MLRKSGGLFAEQDWEELGMTLSDDATRPGTKTKGADGNWPTGDSRLLYVTTCEAILMRLRLIGEHVTESNEPPETSASGHRCYKLYHGWMGSHAGGGVGIICHRLANLSEPGRKPSGAKDAKDVLISETESSEYHVLH